MVLYGKMMDMLKKKNIILLVRIAKVVAPHTESLKEAVEEDWVEDSWR